MISRQNIRLTERSPSMCRTARVASRPAARVYHDKRVLGGVDDSPDLNRSRHGCAFCALESGHLAGESVVDRALTLQQLVERGLLPYQSHEHLASLVLLLHRMFEGGTEPGYGLALSRKRRNHLLHVDDLEDRPALRHLWELPLQDGRVAAFDLVDDVGEALAVVP